MPQKTQRLIVELRDDRLIQQLRAENEVLRDQLEALNASLNRTEFRYSCECKVNMEIVDYCQANGYPLPKRFFTSPHEIWDSP